MEKQYSEEFFCRFVDNMQKLCRNFLDFEQVCEVSGYVCLMMDNSKQERYVLSEMVHNSGSVISESYCTKAFRTLPLQRKNPPPSKHYGHHFNPEFDDEYDSSMDSCMHSSMDSFSGEVPHGLAISNVQSLSTHKGQVAASDPNSRNPNLIMKQKCPEEARIVADKEMIKTKIADDPEPPDINRKKTFSPNPTMAKREKYEMEQDKYDHSIKSENATSTTHDESFLPSKGPNKRLRVVDEEFVHIKQEPETDDFIPNVEIKSNISDLNILKDEFLIAEPIGYLKPKEFPRKKGPNTKTTPRKVYVPLTPEENKEMQATKFVKLVRSNSSEVMRVATQHTAEHLDDVEEEDEEEHLDSDGDFMYDSQCSSEYCSDMENEEDYPLGPMEENNPKLPPERRHTFAPSSIEQGTNLSPDSSRSFVLGHGERDTPNLPVERQHSSTQSRTEQGNKLTQDSHSSFVPSRNEKDTSNLPVERHPPYPPNRNEQGIKLSKDGDPSFVPGRGEKDTSNLPVERHPPYPPNRNEQGIKIPKDNNSSFVPSRGERDTSNLPVERQHIYPQSRLEQSTLPPDHVVKSSHSKEDDYDSDELEPDIDLPQDIHHDIGSIHSEDEDSNLSIEREDCYTSSHMKQGIAFHAAIASGHGHHLEADHSNLSIEREDMYTSSRMEQAIAFHAAIASGKTDPDHSSLSIERQDTYTSSRMEQGIAYRAAIASGHSQHNEEDDSDLTIEREDMYTSSRMEQGIAFRAAIASSQSEQGHPDLSLDSHDIYDPHQMEQVTSTLSIDTHTAAGVPSSLSNISLMEESGDEIIELDSDDIEGDEGLAAATASLSHVFSQPVSNEPSTSVAAQIVVGNESTTKHMKYALNLFTDYSREQGNTEPIHLVPPQKLDLLLSDFYENVRKNKTGEEFTPFSLKNIQSNLQKYLREHNYPYSITSDTAFSKSREKLRNKIEELRGLVRSGVPKVDLLTEEDVEILFQKNQLGACSPDVLFNSMWFMNTMYLGIKSRVEHCNLTWGDIVINVDHTGREFLRYDGFKQCIKNRSRPVFAIMDNPDRCFVELYKIYEDRRHPDLLRADAPFYGTINKLPGGQPWFLPEQVPSTRFNGVLQKMAKEAGLSPGRRFTNSSSLVHRT